MTIIVETGQDKVVFVFSVPILKQDGSIASYQESQFKASLDDCEYIQKHLPEAISKVKANREQGRLLRIQELENEIKKLKGVKQ